MQEMIYMPDEIILARMMTLLDLGVRRLWTTRMKGMRVTMTMGSQPDYKAYPHLLSLQN